MRPLAVSFVFLLALVGLPVGALCQDSAALTKRESELAVAAASRMHELADELQAERQHLRALDLRREIWMDYAPDDQRAREKTGFVQVGRSWRVDPDALVLDRDLKGKKSKIRRIERDLKKFEKEMLGEHRSLAKAWTKQQEPVRAAKHWQRVLRYVPGDAAASAALAIREFEGFAGTEMELRMLRRGRAIHLACDWLNRHEFEVAELQDQRLPLLEAAGLEHSGVQSEFYRVWGTLPVEDLLVLAQDCERSLLLAHTVFGVSTGERFAPRKLRNFVFVRDQGEYAAMVEICRAQFSPSRLAFLRDDVDMCFLDHGGERLRVHKGGFGLPVARDHAVRGVMQDATGVVTEGLLEGVGHAACGFLFGQTLCFMEEQLTEQTSASFTKRRLAPDLDMWMKIAQESAWSKSDTRTSELALIRAARFTNEQRVKAWAICHYLGHWHPEMILELDASKTDLIKTPPDIEREFLRRTGYPLPKVDSEWRAFWGRGAELRAAMTRDPLPNKKAKTRKAVERSRSVVDAINRARAAARVGPLGYYLDASPDFVTVRRYEKALQRAEKQQAKLDKKARKGRKPEQVELPEPPAAIGKTVLWSRAATPDEAVAEWLQNPAVRDQLLAPGRELLAAASDVGGFLVGTALPAARAERGEPMTWPRAGQADVAGQVRVAELAPRLQRAVLAAGVGEDAVVGMPVSLHFGRDIDAATLAGIGCALFERNRPLAGVVVPYADAEGVAVPGLVACVPLAPLGSGKQIEVRWEVPQSLLGKDQQMSIVPFSVR